MTPLLFGGGRAARNPVIEEGGETSGVPAMTLIPVEDYYNYHRPHGALDGQTPYERLLARKASAKVVPKS